MPYICAVLDLTNQSNTRAKKKSKLPFHLRVSFSDLYAFKYTLTYQNSVFMKIANRIDQQLNSSSARFSQLYANICTNTVAISSNIC